MSEGRGTIFGERRTRDDGRSATGDERWTVDEGFGAMGEGRLGNRRWAAVGARRRMGDGLRRMDGGRWALLPSDRGTEERDVMVVLVIVVCWTKKWKDPQSSPRHAMNEGREWLLSLLFCGGIERKEEKRNGIVAASTKKRKNTSSCPSLLPFLVAFSCSAYRLIAHRPSPFVASADTTS